VRRVRIVGVVQARLGSTRLPGKILLSAAGRPLLERMLERVLVARELDDVVVATTRVASDGTIRDLCARLGVPCVSGDEHDLISRHLLAARRVGADAVAKLPSDCPLIDPAVIDEVVGTYRSRHPRYSFVSNLHPPTWPDGNDVEVMSVAALEDADREATLPFQREHTTPFIWDRPERFPQLNVAWSTGADLSATHRLTLDYPEDYAVICAVFEALHRPSSLGAPFGVEEVVAFLDAHPEIAALNARHAGTVWTQRHEHELRTRLWRPGAAAGARAEEKPAP
jgi:spore coat polysaccharide biosynthesis protein SpsF